MGCELGMEYRPNSIRDFMEKDAYGEDRSKDHLPSWRKGGHLGLFLGRGRDFGLKEKTLIL